MDCTVGYYFNFLLVGVIGDKHVPPKGGQPLRLARVN